MEQINKLLDRLDVETNGIGVIERAASQIGTRRAYVVLGSGAFAFVFVFLGVGVTFITHIVGCLFPVYASFRAIEAATREPTAHEDIMQWLMYWVIYACFNVIESVSDRLLFWFPMYYAAKIAFLLYCQLPMCNGARFLYLQFVGPWFRAHRATLEAQAARLGGAATVFTEAVQKVAVPRAAAAVGVPPEVDPSEIFGMRQRTAAGGSSGTGAAGGVSGGDTRR